MTFLDLEIGAALLWGGFGTGVLTLIMAASQGFGWSRMSFPFMIGSMFSSRRSRAMILGFALHFFFGMVFALLYALVFESWRWANWWLGAMLGTFHGLFILIVLMPVLPDVHPRMASKHHGPSPTRQLEPPGFMALNYGQATPALTLVAHVIYGILLGAFY